MSLLRAIVCSACGLLAVPIMQQGSAGTPAHPAPPVAPPLAQAHIVKALGPEFWAALSSDGQLYCYFRDLLLQKGASIRPLLSQLAERGDSWQERTLAHILVERLHKQEKITELLRHPPQIGSARTIGAAFSDYPRIIAEACKQTPMLLVEAVWKDSRWLEKCGRVYSYPQGETRAHVAFVAAALGILKERRATDVLTWLLASDGTDAGDLVVRGVADGLREMGEHRVIPQLLDACAMSDSTAKDACLMAIGKLVDKENLGVVVSHHRRLVDTQRALSHLIGEKGREFGGSALDRKRPGGATRIE